VAIALSAVVVDHKRYRCECEFCLEKNFTPHYLHGVPPNANVDYTVTVARCEHKNPAGTIHLDSLLDENALLGLCHTVPRLTAMPHASILTT
jgi:hypothetical protein